LKAPAPATPHPVPGPSPATRALPDSGRGRHLPINLIGSPFRPNGRDRLSSSRAALYKRR
jgi:hypothetical protein